MRAARLALVPGEPAGVGPELCIRLAQTPSQLAGVTVFGDAKTLQRAASALAMPLRLLPADAEPKLPGDLPLHDVPAQVVAAFGRPEPSNATSTMAALDLASSGCLEGKFAGLVTGPFHKAAINDGGIAYTGTTGRLAEQAGCEVVMMLARPDLRVALVTTHLPLRAVADAITPQAVERAIRITETALRRDFGIATPRIAVLGLNPHAGEDGHLGREELDILFPVLERLRGDGFELIGPLPADTAFLPEKLASFDAVLAMYHDQGLPVLKSTGLETAVNVTLGLPYPRVAVDHGTALDIAGLGLASVGSLRSALELCRQLAAR